MTVPSTAIPPHPSSHPTTAPSPSQPQPPLGSAALSAAIPRLVPRKRDAPSQRQRGGGPGGLERGGSGAGAGAGAVDPPPATPSLPAPPDLAGHTYVHPSRRILGKDDHALFLQSPTCQLVQAWIFGLADAVRDRSITSIKDAELNPTVHTILAILSAAEQTLQRCPPEDTGSRFGNPVFRTFLDRIGDQLPAWHAQLGLSSPSQADETATYLHHAFGNRARIDYGSGHELNFFLWLLCLNRASLLPPATFPALGLVVLPAYLRLMRRIQASYYLEPAGSHGVWGLDDYQFLPFLLGASQLVRHPYITPRSIHSAITLEEFGSEYLYLDQVAFVNSVKNVEGLRWHSPMLDDISASKNWAKIEGGMRKMFVKEILEKLPVMQHFLFGSLIPAVEGMSVEDDFGGDDDDELQGGEVRVFTDEGGQRHVHAAKGWSDCCGIRVPSAVGAEGEERKMGGGRGLRRVPFD